MDAELTVGTEIAVHLDGNKIEEINGKPVDGNFEDIILIGKAQVALTGEEQNGYFCIDPNQETAGCHTQVFSRAARIDL